MLKIAFRKYFELAFWAGGLMLLALFPPGSHVHYSLCFFKMTGISFCPGCGLGHSIGYLIYGDIKKSFSTHPFGVLAVLIILFRIRRLIILHLFTQKTKNEYATG